MEEMDNIVTKKQALNAGVKRFFTGFPCKYGHVAERYVGNRSCVICSLFHVKKSYFSNLEQSRKRKRKLYRINHKREIERNRLWRSSNRKKCCESAKNWAIANPERKKVTLKAWKKINKERINRTQKIWFMNNPERKRIYYERYYLANKAKFFANVLKRNLLIDKATPKWADFDLMNDMYIEAKYFQMEVDHIVPLQGKNVCGLHWEGNMQLLTLLENRRKSNTFTS